MGFEAVRQDMNSKLSKLEFFLPFDKTVWKIKDDIYLALAKLVFREGIVKDYRDSVRVRDLVNLLESDGWYWVVRTKGSHHQYKHPTKLGVVTVPGNLRNLWSKDMAIGTLNNILKQAGLKP